MRLIPRTLLLFLVISLPLLLLAGWYSYRHIEEEVQDATDEALYRQKLELQELIKATNEPRNLYLRSDSLTGITLLPRKIAINQFSDTVLYDRVEEEWLKYRVYRAYYIYEGKHYLLSCAKPAVEEDELTEGLLKGLFLVIGFLIFALLVVNLLVSRRLWRPFYAAIEKLDSYRLDEHQRLHFDKTSILEFRRLNESLEKMTNKIAKDYLRQKEFTENASHELQTPLAIIRTKLDLLLQSQLGAEESDILQALDAAVYRIINLNKALLLLTKIENRQFSDHTSVNFNVIIDRACETYSMLFEHKRINLKRNITSEVAVDMNVTLAEVLVNNLVQNAFRHNREDGEVIINLRKEFLEVRNTGAPLAISEEQLFERFKKNNASRESLGLGLSIVQSIATIYNFRISYKFEKEEHVFRIYLKGQTDLL